MLRAGNQLSRDVERLMRDGVDPPGGDARLLQRFLENRDQSAFEAIVDRHGPQVLSLCRRYLREPADVEDAFQATFLVLVRKGAGLRDPDALSSWLYGVAHRVAVRARSDALKRRSREGNRDGVSEAVDGATAPIDDSLEVLDGELSRLPEKYRAPLVLCYLRGRTHDQAADELGWPVGTVRSRMARGRSILHDRLSRRGVDVSACLTAARLDLAAAAVPSSLVAATTSAAGRFAALAAGLGWIWRASPSSTTWPAAALAEGVLSTMSTTPWKLLGFAFLSTGLTAGTVAFATGPRMSPMKQDDPPKPQAPPEAKTAPQPGEPSGGRLEARLAEVENKLDRLLQAIERPQAIAPPPASSSPVEPAAPRSIDPKGLREIEAELINNYQKYEYILKLAEREVVSRTEVDVVVAPARLLVARLRDMESIALKDEERAKKIAPSFEDRAARQYEVHKTKQALDSAKEAAKKVGLTEKDLDELVGALPPMSGGVFQGPGWIGGASGRAENTRSRSEVIENIHKILDDPDRRTVFNDYRQAWQEVRANENLQAAMKEPIQRYEECKARTLAIQKLIKWAREHFKDVELTIEDAEKAN